MGAKESVEEEEPGKSRNTSLVRNTMLAGLTHYCLAGPACNIAAGPGTRGYKRAETAGWLVTRVVQCLQDKA